MALRRSARLVAQTKAPSNWASAAVNWTAREEATNQVKPELQRLKAELAVEDGLCFVKMEPKLEDEAILSQVSKTEEDGVDNAKAEEVLQEVPVDLEDACWGRKWSPPAELSRSALDALIGMYGPRSRSETSGGSVVDSLVRTILSQNTTDVNSLKCFDLLKARFDTWEELLETDDDEVADTIKMGGLSQIKTQRIKAIFRQLKSDHGCISMEHLRGESTEKVKKELSRYKGVGPKTIACVLLFTLERDDFPVDTHVCRISQRLGWSPPKATREDTYEVLNARLPDDIKYQLHLLLVHHGKVTCQAAKPNCQACTMRPLCKTGRKSMRKRARAKDELFADQNPEDQPST